MKTGNDILIEELEALLAEARDFQFDDFKNTKYATPKMVLRARFLSLADDVVKGRFD